MNMKQSLVAASFAFVIGVPLCVHGAPYTFEGLTAGGLVGQDNWTSALGPGRDQTVQPGVGINLTTVAGAPDVASGLVARINDANYSFTAFTGTETAATMQFDVTLSAAGGPHVALAHDSNADGSIEALNEVGPAFGIANGGNFYIRGAAYGLENQEAVGAAGSIDDWFQVRLVMDFTANGGDGSGSFHYRNLTLGQTSFTPVASLQNVNLEMISSRGTGGPAPSTFDAIWSRTDGGGLYDNIDPNFVVSSQAGDFDADGDVDGADFVAWQTHFPTASGATLADGDADADGDVDGADFVVWQTNFPFTPGPGVAPVPEPQSLCLCAIGMLIVGRAFGRRKDVSGDRSGG